MKNVALFFRKLIHHVSHPNHQPVYCIHYDGYYPHIKQGKSLSSADFLIPVDDVLHFDLFTQGEHQYLVTYVTSRFLFFIPYSYYQFIIDLNGTKYPDNLITSEQVCHEILQVEHPDIYSDIVEPIQEVHSVLFDGSRGKFRFNISPAYYQFVGHKD